MPAREIDLTSLLSKEKKPTNHNIDVKIYFVSSKSQEGVAKAKRYFFGVQIPRKVGVLNSIHVHFALTPHTHTHTHIKYSKLQYINHLEM